MPKNGFYLKSETPDEGYEYAWSLYLRSSGMTTPIGLLFYDAKENSVEVYIDMFSAEYIESVVLDVLPEKVKRRFPKVSVDFQGEAY